MVAMRQNGEKMSQDKMNTGSEDLQKTMEIPAIGGKNEPVGEIFDPWHLDKGGPPEDILSSIAKTLEKAEKMSGTMSIPLQPEEEQPSEENLKEETGSLFSSFFTTG